MEKQISSIEEKRATYSVEEIGEVLGVSRATAYNLVNSKDFPVIRIGKRMVVPKLAFQKWMEDHTQVGA